MKVLLPIPTGTCTVVKAEPEVVRPPDPRWDDPNNPLYWSSPLPGSVIVTCSYLRGGQKFKVPIEKMNMLRMISKFNRELMLNSTKRKEDCEDFE